jgi:hypothetical protein
MTRRQKVFGGLHALAVRVGAVLRVSWRLGVEVPAPLGLEDCRHTP